MKQDDTRAVIGQRRNPRGPLDLVCDEPYENADVTGIRCHLSAGHRGDHEGVSIVTWPDEWPGSFPTDDD